MTTKLKTTACTRCGGTGQVPGETTGSQLREAREKANISRDLVAKHMDQHMDTGVSVSYLRDLELGFTPWSQAKVDAYLEALEELA